MSKPNIPEMIVNYNAYQDGAGLLGLASEVQLPQFEAMTETISGAGIAGEYEVAIPGHFGSQTIEFQFRALDEQMVKLMEPRRKTIVLRASQQGYNVTSGEKRYDGLKISVRGVPKSSEGGKIAVGKPTESKVTLEITYYKVEKNGKVLIEYDKLNMIYIIDGVDYLEEIRNQI